MSWTTTSRGKNLGWLTEIFGLEGALVVATAQEHGYGVTVSHEPTTYSYRFGVFRDSTTGVTRDISQALGIYDSADDVINTLRLFISIRQQEKENGTTE